MAAALVQHLRAVIDAGRDFNFDRLLLGDDRPALAAGAGVGNDRPAPAAAGAGLPGLEDALADDDLAVAGAALAEGRRRALLGSRALAVTAQFLPLDGDGAGDAFGSFHE